jgi:sugar/nucleoside kinase (ribokinase family)
MTTSAAELLQKVFKTLADPTRVRILRLLEQEVHVPGLTVQAVDATAAGDTFVGYFACAIAEGQPLAEALALANAAAARSVTQVGAMPSIPLRSQI